MKVAALCFLLLGALPIAGCATKKSATEKNFSEALNAYLVKKGLLCIGLASNWPIDIDLRDRGTSLGQAPAMAALQNVGLVHSYESETFYTPLLSDRPVKHEVLRYELTDEGRQFYREKDYSLPNGPSDVHGDLCYGQEAVDGIVKWQGPLDLGNYKQVSVFYTYKIEQLAGWVSNADVRRAFPSVALTINGAGQRILSNTLILTNRGWEAE
ncbi:MAG TPA: hypothetical protein VHX36_00960 [Candidatus Acidoferrales bacterium]|jgi:hypothetical protein|nr:hypothetical protein [Candidatus Acidoferrales bacterium]